MGIGWCESVAAQKSVESNPLLGSVTARESVMGVLEVAVSHTVVRAKSEHERLDLSGNVIETADLARVGQSVTPGRVLGAASVMILLVGGQP